MENIFVLWYRFFNKHRILFWCVFALAVAVPAWFAAKIRLEEDITSIIPKDEKTRALTELFQQSRLLEKLIITVSHQDRSITEPDSLVAYADELAAALQQKLPAHVAAISAKVDEDASMELLQTIIDHLPVFLEEQDYSKIDSLISEKGVKATLEKNFRTLTAPSGLALKQFIARDPAGIAGIALKKLQLLQYDQQFTLYDGHIITQDQQQLVIFVSPAFPKNNTAANGKLIDGLDHIIDSLSTLHRGVQASYYGGTAVAVGNARQLRQDTLLTQGITVLLLILFIAIYFRRLLAPLLMLVPAVFGALLALACISLIKGSISVIALGTGSIILGIAVNYSLHLLNHHRHHPDMEAVLRDLSHPMTIGSITTIGGFLCMQWVESALLRDLALFGAFSLIGAAFCSLVFLPQLISAKPSDNAPHEGWIDRLAAYRPDSNGKLVGLILLLTIVLAFFARRVSFEPDMNRMNYLPERLRKAEQEVNALNAFALQSVYVLSAGRDLQSALRQNEAAAATLDSLQGKGIIRKYSGVSTVLISDSLQAHRIARWNQYWSKTKIDTLISRLQTTGQGIGFKPAAFQPVQVMLTTAYTPVADTTLQSLTASLTDNYIIRSDTAVKLLTLVKTTTDRKAALYAAFSGRSAQTALDMQYVTSRLVDMVRTDFNSISWMAASIVFIVLLISFGRIELTLISFVPMLITWIWILGIMALLGISFNIVNIIISALIFGLGDDYSLFTIDGLLQEYKTGKKNLDSFKSSIFLSAITTVVGLGVLIFAKHPSLRSIAFIAITGILCVVLISQVMIPFLFRLLITNRTSKGKPPLTAWHLLTSVFAFSYFTIGSLILSVFALLLVKLNPFAGRRSKYAYQFLLSKFTKSLLYIMANVRKTVINKAKEDFSQPAVIISNHQSFLDILSIVMLHPKIVLVTNDWVWNSPVFGFVVRTAGYLPVAAGIEQQMDKVRQTYAEGYSIAIFPEGTRSPDGQIKRFHKGAFYLAEQLGADILPVMLLGTGHTMGKGDYMLKDGHIIVEILPRMSAGDLRYGNGYAERAKAISREFKQQFLAQQRRYEQGDWFAKDLVANYIYKGPSLEWYIRIKSKLEKHYQLFLDLVPEKGNMLDIGCGYGAMSYMLHMVSKERVITGVDYDVDKIETANHCYARDHRINFVAANILDFPMAEYDAIIMADMLHYLPPSDQELLVQKALSHLSPGGRLIIREGNAELTRAHRRTELTEFFSTRIMRFNKSDKGRLYFLAASDIRQLAVANGFGCREIRDSQLTSNSIFIIEKTYPAHGS